MSRAFLKMLAVVGVIGSTGLQTPSHADVVEDFFFTQQGSLPIIILAPHGGSEQPIDIENERATDDPDDVILNDFRTDQLALKAVADVQAILGGNVYYVVNDISRRYIDLNRDKTVTGTVGNAAFEDPDAEKYYDFYHATARTFIDEIIANHGGGLLLDIHGQGAVPGTVFRGTNNGAAVTDMLAEHGDVALIGPDSIFGQLETLGYNIDPENQPLNADPEVTYIGGYTVDIYGSDNPNGIDTIQIEWGSNYRFDPIANAWEQSGTDLATAIAAYHNTFIIPEPGTVLLLGLGTPLLLRRRCM